MSYRDRQDHAKETGETLRSLRGMVRRLAITLTDGVLWQLLGQRGGQGGDEVIHLEVFPNIGFYSRPPKTGKPEAIAVAIAAAAKGRVVVGTRDLKTLKEIEAELPGGKLDENETVIYCGAVFIHLRANGTVEIRTPGGGSVNPVSLLKDIVALRNWAATHTHSGVTTGMGASGAPISAPPTPQGSEVLFTDG
jgi:hypothetical protein